VVVEVGPMTEQDCWESAFSNELLNRQANLGDILLNEAAEDFVAKFTAWIKTRVE
jgi:hypothetical protein